MGFINQKKSGILILDVYELTEEEMKENALYYKKRCTVYNYMTDNVEDFALTEHNDLSKYKVGSIIE